MSKVRSVLEYAGGLIARNRSTAVLALALAIISSGTAAATSYLVLGGSNSAGKTTTLSSAVNGATLNLKNTNSIGGTAAKGLNIVVPGGRPPITVNASAGTATNLDADKLDGKDSTAFGRVVDFAKTVAAASTGTRTLASLRALTLTGESEIISGPLLECTLFATTSDAGQFDDAWTFEAMDGSTYPLADGTSTPATNFFVARARGNGSRSVGQLIFRDGALGHTVTVAYSVYGIANADINGQGCTWQGTLTAAGF